MSFNRRSLIIGAGLGVAAPKLVLAESLIDLPAITTAGLGAAEHWAEHCFADSPGCRLVYSNDYRTGWYRWGTMRRTAGGEAFAVAIETRTVDERGRTFITTTPVDGAGFHRGREQHFGRAFEKMRHMQEIMEF